MHPCDLVLPPAVPLALSKAVLRPYTARPPEGPAAGGGRRWHPRRTPSFPPTAGGPRPQIPFRRWQSFAFAPSGDQRPVAAAVRRPLAPLAAVIDWSHVRRCRSLAWLPQLPVPLARVAAGRATRAPCAASVAAAVPAAAAAAAVSRVAKPLARAAGWRSIRASRAASGAVPVTTAAVGAGWLAFAAAFVATAVLSAAVSFFSSFLSFYEFFCNRPPHKRPLQPPNIPPIPHYSHSPPPPPPSLALDQSLLSPPSGKACSTRVTPPKSKRSESPTMATPSTSPIPPGTSQHRPAWRSHRPPLSAPEAAQSTLTHGGRAPIEARLTAHSRGVHQVVEKLPQ